MFVVTETKKLPKIIIYFLHILESETMMPPPSSSSTQSISTDEIPLSPPSTQGSTKKTDPKNSGSRKGVILQTCT